MTTFNRFLLKNCYHAINVHDVKEKSIETGRENESYTHCHEITGINCAKLIFFNFYFDKHDF